MTPLAARYEKERFYDTIADSFDDIMNAYDVRRRLEVVFDELLADVDLREKSLLDAGCGTGRFSESAVCRGATVTSVDIGASLLKHVARRCAARPACGDIMQLPFADETFDVVISSECIEHTPDPQRAVNELIRVCRAGGQIVITCPNRAWHWSLAVANALRIRPYAGLENWPGWFQLRRWIRSAGAACVKSKGIHLFPFHLNATHGVLRSLDCLGGALGPLYVNQAVLAVRTRSAPTS